MNGFFDWIFKSLGRLIFGLPRAAPAVSPFEAGHGPGKLVILRHAEKTGAKKDDTLSDAGTARAQRLARWIPQTFGRVDFLVAAKTSKRSRRPVETIEPLAAAQGGLAIDDRYDDEEVDELVHHLGKKDAYRGKTGVVSWRHSDIPRLVAALGAPDGTLEKHWHEDDYSTIVELTFRDGKVSARRLTMPF